MFARQGQPRLTEYPCTLQSSPGDGRIPEAVKQEVRSRIEEVAEARFRGLYTRLDIRFDDRFCYVDAFQEPDPPDDCWADGEWPETLEQYLERVRNTPIHLCRLRYVGNDRWGFALYAYCGEKYEPTVYPDGELLGKAEDAFAGAASLYLEGMG